MHQRGDCGVVGLGRSLLEGAARRGHRRKQRGQRLVGEQRRQRIVVGRDLRYRQANSQWASPVCGGCEKPPSNGCQRKAAAQAWPPFSTLQNVQMIGRVRRSDAKAS